MPAPRTGGQILAAALHLHGVRLVFCVPGESYLDALDALYDYQDNVRVVTCRHEGGASYMAEAYGKLTGEPGVALVTRGPGAANAAVGVHTAQQDSTPMILLVGQIARGMRDREAFQEVDLAAVYGSLAKWAATIDDAARIPEYLARAYTTAVSGRPGPVVLGLPEDMLAEVASVDDVRAAAVAATTVSDAFVTELCSLVRAAQRPLAILGGSGWSALARDRVSGFLERSGIPAVCAFRRQDLLDNRSPSYAGYAGIGMSPALARRIAGADVVVAIGTRLGDATTQGYTLLDVPVPQQTLIHVHPDRAELGRVYQPRLAVAATMDELGAALARTPALDGARWAEWSHAARAEYEATRAAGEAGARAGFVDLEAVVRYLDERLPDDAVVTNGAGNFAGWLNRFYRYKAFRTQLAPANGSMGYGVPAAVAAKLAQPRRMVVAFTGDGDFLMNGQELATAVQYQAPIVVVLANNGMYGTIRMHQELRHPERTIGTGLVNPRFDLLARAYGCHAESLSDAALFPAAFEAAVAAGTPALIELRTDPESISTRATIGMLRERARASS